MLNTKEARYKSKMNHNQKKREGKEKKVTLLSNMPCLLLSNVQVTLIFSGLRID